MGVVTSVDPLEVRPDCWPDDGIGAGWGEVEPVEELVQAHYRIGQKVRCRDIEEEPIRPPMTDSEDEDGKKNHIATPRKHRDSIGLSKERACNTSKTPDDKPEATPTQAPQASITMNLNSRAGIKVHLLWFACSCGVAMFFGRFAFQAEAPRPNPSPAVVTFGDPACWVDGFRPEQCCLGQVGGNPACWDKKHTYERCCLGQNAH